MTSTKGQSYKRLAAPANDVWLKAINPRSPHTVDVFLVLGESVAIFNSGHPPSIDFFEAGTFPRPWIDVSVGLIARIFVCGVRVREPACFPLFSR